MRSSPKPLADEAGNGLHINLSVYDETSNLFADQKSECMAAFTAGILRRIREISVFLNPMACSYQRLIKNKGFDDKYYKDLIVEYLKQYDKARKKEIRELLWDKLPDALSEKQKENKIRNLLYSLKQKQIIETDSTNQQKSNWILKK